MKDKKPHRNLIAWRKAMDLVAMVYDKTNTFPKDEIYGLTSQLRRAAVSVPSNIAEGAADRTSQQFTNFLSNAVGSLNEIDTQLEIALRLGYISNDVYRSICVSIDECLALTYGLRKSVKEKIENRE